MIALTWFVFDQTLHHEFVDYDDNTYVYENPKIIAIGLGDILFARGKVEEATAEFRTALHLRPNSASAHQNLGVAFLKSGAIDEAIGHLQTALRIKPDHPTAHFNLGNAFLQKGEPNPAIAQYEEQLALQPEHVVARCNLGSASATERRIKSGNHSISKSD